MWLQTNLKLDQAGIMFIYLSDGFKSGTKQERRNQNFMAIRITAVVVAPEDKSGDYLCH